MKKWAIGIAKKGMEIVAVDEEKWKVIEIAQEYKNIPRSDAVVFILSADFDEENKQTDNHIQFYEIIN